MVEAKIFYNSAKNGQLSIAVCEIKLDAVCEIKFAECSIYKSLQNNVQNEDLRRSRKKMTVHQDNPKMSHDKTFVFRELWWLIAEFTGLFITQDQCQITQVKYWNWGSMSCSFTY